MNGGEKGREQRRKRMKRGGGGICGKRETGQKNRVCPARWEGDETNGRELGREKTR